MIDTLSIFTRMLLRICLSDAKVIKLKITDSEADIKHLLAFYYTLFVVQFESSLVLLCMNHSDRFIMAAPCAFFPSHVIGSTEWSQSWSSYLKQAYKKPRATT
jgi:hypothetical protein